MPSRALIALARLYIFYTQIIEFTSPYHPLRNSTDI